MASRPVSPKSTRSARRVSCVLGLLGLVVVLWARSSSAGSNELLVILNSKNPVARLSASDLRHIFQTRKSKWESGALVEPVNLPEKSPQRQSFDRAVMGFDPEMTVRYWIDRKVRGEARPPKRLATPAAVLAHVASSPGGIGYLPADSVPGAAVKVVARVQGDQVKAP